MKLIGGNITVTLEKLTTTPNLIGEMVKTYEPAVELFGYLDLQTSGKDNTLDAFLQDSTHIFLCDYKDLSEYQLTPENCRLVCEGKPYQVLTIDDPMGIHYQLEIYLKYLGWNNG